MRDVRMQLLLGVAMRRLIASRPYLSGYRGALLGMTWLASRVVETVDVADRA